MMENSDLGRVGDAEQALVNGTEQVVSVVPASILRVGLLQGLERDSDKFLAEQAEKKRLHSDPNPQFWRGLLEKANPPSLGVCKHLESEEADANCPCGYPGSIWADDEHVLLTMGDQWGDKGLQAPRIERSAEIATARLMTALYNNAEWLIDLAAQAIEARSDTTGTGVAVGESAVRQDAPDTPDTPKETHHD